MIFVYSDHRARNVRLPLQQLFKHDITVNRADRFQHGEIVSVNGLHCVARFVGQLFERKRLFFFVFFPEQFLGRKRCAAYAFDDLFRERVFPEQCFQSKLYIPHSFLAV